MEVWGLIRFQIVRLTGERRKNQRLSLGTHLCLRLGKEAGIPFLLPILDILGL